VSGATRFFLSPLNLDEMGREDLFGFKGAIKNVLSGRYVGVKKGATRVSDEL